MILVRLTSVGKVLATLTLFYFCCHGDVDGYPTGDIPASACESMRPGHGVDPQSEDPPFTVTVSKATYAAEETLQVTLSGDSFLGFMLQARRTSGDTAEPIGTFVPIADTHLLCSEGALTHFPKQSRTSLAVSWVAPTTLQGELQFRVTVVKTWDTFWVDVVSDFIQQAAVDPSGDSSTTATTTTTTTPPETNQCGAAAGCFRFPETCTGNDCTMTLHWTPEGFSDSRRRKRHAGAGGGSVNYVDFDLTGVSDGWVAFALSTDQEMEDDSVMECVLDANNDVNVFMSYNGNQFNENNKFTSGLSETSGSYVDGRLTCHFRRATQVSDNAKVFSLDEDHYLLMATGPVTGDAMKQYHQSKRTISDKKVKLTEGGSLSGSLVSLDLYKAHGLCMLAAWMVTASIGMLMPRFFKDAWADKELCKTKVWFSIHRLLMTLTFLLTVAGFVMIFVAEKSYSQLQGYQRAHPPMGIVVTFLVILNPIMAAFRPHPGTPKRPIFNWAHWAVGRIALILAIITTFFGFKLPTAALFTSAAPYGILIGLTVFHVVVYLGFEIHQAVARKRAAKQGKEMEMHTNGSQQREETNKTPNKDLKVRYALLAICIIVTLACFVAIAVLMATEAGVTS